jgi:hypothetical protein
MPPRTTAPKDATTATPAARPRTAAARKKSAPAAAPADEIAPLETFAEHTGARPFPVLDESDTQLNTRSFQLPIGSVQRLRATADAIQHRVYETPLEGKAPDSISGSVVEAIDAWCTYYEDLLNNGQPFRRARKLAPGPRRSGAQRGAEKRSETARVKREARDGDD